MNTSVCWLCGTDREGTHGIGFCVASLPPADASSTSGTAMTDTKYEFAARFEDQCGRDVDATSETCRLPKNHRGGCAHSQPGWRCEGSDMPAPSSTSGTAMTDHSTTAALLSIQCQPGCHVFMSPGLRCQCGEMQSMNVARPDGTPNGYFGVLPTPFPPAPLGGSSAADAMSDVAIDGLLRDFQEACEAAQSWEHVCHRNGGPQFSDACKRRAILRNEIRSRLRSASSASNASAVQSSVPVASRSRDAEGAKTRDVSDADAIDPESFDRIAFNSSLYEYQSAVRESVLAQFRDGNETERESTKRRVTALHNSLFDAYARIRARVSSSADARTEERNNG